MTERVAFGAELRRARERRGLTLDEIAEQTKVSATHFAGLERAELHRWPSGIFRRAFVRSYALAVGLEPEATVARFCRLFPDPADELDRATSLAAAAPTADADEPGLRLALEAPRPSPTPALSPVVRRLVASLLDVCVALVPASLVALAFGVQWFWPVAGCVGLAGHVACYAMLGTTPGPWLMGRLVAPIVVVAPPVPDRRRLEPEGTPAASRRRVVRHGQARSAPHAHRVRH